jgi:osmoprotectant transport system permease protein
MPSLTRQAAPAALLGLLLLAAAALAGLPLVTAAPNRLLSGTGQSLATVLAVQAAWWPAPIAALLLAAGGTLLARWRNAALWGVCVALAVLFCALLAWAGGFASLASAETGSLGRTSLGSGFWLGSLLLWLAASEARRQLQAERWLSLLPGLLVLAGVAALLLTAQLDALSSLKEYASHSEQFWSAIAQHLHIVGLTVLLTVLSGFPLGIWLHRHAAASGRVFLLLNFVQTIPSIAMFGLLMALLAVAGKALPWLHALGVNGVGLTPAVLALSLYSLLPLVRSIFSGLQQVPSGVRESALAMGLSRRQLLWQVELPLALPVLLSGLKVMLIQAIGLAAVAALIGAGGLGALMFEGLFSSAIDLVTLAVLPIVALSVLADSVFSALAALSARHGAGPEVSDSA